MPQMSPMNWCFLFIFLLWKLQEQIYLTIMMIYMADYDNKFIFNFWSINSLFSLNWLSSLTLLLFMPWFSGWLVSIGQ